MGHPAASQDHSPPGTPVGSVLLSRQPIFDPSLTVHGYELLYHTVGAVDPAHEDPDHASAEVICTGFIDIGLARIVQNRPAYINVSRDLLVSRQLMALPTARVVLEFPGYEEPDQEFLDALDEHRGEGFRLVLRDAPVGPDNVALVKRAHAVKLDVGALGLPGAMHQVELITPLHREIIASRLDSAEDYAAMAQCGAHWFQGAFFAQPRIVEGTRLKSNKLATLRLLGALYDPDTEIDKVSAMVSEDAALSYKLLRFMNSAFLSLPSKVDSIQRAVVFLGLAALKRWASLMVVASVEDKPSELTRTLLVRARLCEQLCLAAKRRDPAAAFTAGLFSGLDALMDLPLAKALVELPLSDELNRALLEGEGCLGSALGCALAFEQGHWDGVCFAEVPVHVIGTLYADAAVWAGEAMQGL
jgi:EAL and modified HD-GYP domain-containing signal transduction protein